MRGRGRLRSAGCCGPATAPRTCTSRGRRLPSRAGRGAPLPAAGLRACCRAEGRRAAPAAGSTGGQHPPCSPRGAPAAQRSSTHQQRRQTRCSRTVPFTELSRLTGKRTITGISPVPQQSIPPKKGGGVKKKKGRAFLLFSFPPNPAFNQKNKA